jgi:acyl carrier protein
MGSREERLSEILSQMTGSSEGPDSNIAEVLDSLQIVEFILTAQREFQRPIDIDDLNPSDVCSIKNFAAALQRSDT